MKYQINYTYSLPEMGTIELDFEDVNDVYEAEDRALSYLEMTYPDIIDIEVTDIKELKE